MSDEQESRDERSRPRYSAAGEGAGRRSADRGAPRRGGSSAGQHKGGGYRGDRAGDAKSHGDKPRSSRPYGDRSREGGGKPSGEKKSYGDKPYRPRDGKPAGGTTRAPRAHGDKPHTGSSYGDGSRGRKPYVGRARDGKPYGDRARDGRPSGDATRSSRPYGDKPRTGRPFAGKRERKPYGDKPYEKRTARPARDESKPRHPAPFIPDEVTPKDLNPAARNELKTLSKENAERVARHLAMAAALIDEDPALAHEHALAATRSAGRIAVVRETAAITAYAIGDYALALRELRTYRRISGRDDQIALMVDSERGVGRPDRALELGRSVDRSALPPAVRVELAIAMSGARLDLGETERALLELDIPELDPDRAFEWSPGLFAARATVLDELGRTEEAEEWRRRAVVAAEAIEEALGVADSETVFVEEVIEEVIEEALDEGAETQDAGADASGEGTDGEGPEPADAEHEPLTGASGDSAPEGDVTP